MTLVLFPDTTALINFATIERMDLLGKIAVERAWCGSVSDECSAWAGEPDLSSIRRAWDIFGEPLRPDTPVEHLTTRTYYERLRVPGEPTAIIELARIARSGVLIRPISRRDGQNLDDFTDAVDRGLSAAGLHT